MLGVIGGSGIYDLDGLADGRWVQVDTPFGPPSDAVLVGRLDGIEVAFLPRHGRGHRILPGHLNFRANVSALKQLGVTDVLSLSAVGSLREDLPPGTFVVVDQFVDLTTRRRSFFDEGLAVHVSMADPTCGRIGAAVAEAAADEGGAPRVGGTYVCIEGPQFSTRAESEVYRGWGADVIGMTNMPEAKLAREAEMCFATLAMVTDYDCWHPDHGDVTAATVAATFAANAARARQVVRRVVPALAEHPSPCPHGCDRALDDAVITAPGSRDRVRAALLASAGLRVGGSPPPVEDPHDLGRLVRTVPDFPRPGILFRDITTLLEDGEGLRRTVGALAGRARPHGIDRVVGIDARGFILGGALAFELGVGFVAVRKQGKLPGRTARMDYELEYGTDAVEVREGGIPPGARVLVVDDLLATGGTAEAAIKLARQQGAEVVEACFVIELPDLGGRARLLAQGCAVHSLVAFAGH
ncbi:MAG: S-methyl-5'-thioadenosine phosphorylase [Acidimicrobiia bacterium]